MEAHSRAYEVFRLWLAHAQRQSGEKGNRPAQRSSGARNISLPYVHQQQGVAELVNRLVAAAIMEQDTRGEFTGGDYHDSDDDDDDSPGGGAGAGGGSARGAAPPAPPEPESDDDDMQEVIPHHRHDTTVSGLQLLELYTATSTAPRVIEPKNPRQALTGPHSKEWHEAMDVEIKALESRDTWVLVDRAAIMGRRILSRKWVFRVKTAADGTIEQFKACWVVRGYDQRHCLDYDETFAPVSHHTF
ncbi:unnamed protein product [Closterium sp. NIES-53]